MPRSLSPRKRASRTSKKRTSKRTSKKRTSKKRTSKKRTSLRRLAGGASPKRRSPIRVGSPTRRLVPVSPSLRPRHSAMPREFSRTWRMWLAGTPATNATASQLIFDLLARQPKWAAYFDPQFAPTIVAAYTYRPKHGATEIRIELVLLRPDGIRKAPSAFSAFPTAPASAPASASPAPAPSAAELVAAAELKAAAAAEFKATAAAAAELKTALAHDATRPRVRVDARKLTLTSRVDGRGKMDAFETRLFPESTADMSQDPSEEVGEMVKTLRAFGLHALGARENMCNMTLGLS